MVVAVESIANAEESLVEPLIERIDLEDKDELNDWIG